MSASHSINIVSGAKINIRKSGGGVTVLGGARRINIASRGPQGPAVLDGDKGDTRVSTGVWHFERTNGSPGNGTSDDAPYWQDSLSAGRSIILSDRKSYIMKSPVTITEDGTGIVGNNALVRMSTEAGAFDNDTYADRYSVSNSGSKYAVAFYAANIDGAFIDGLRITLSSWVDLLYLKAAYFDTCTNLSIKKSRFYGFSRGKGLVSLKDCGTTYSPAGEILNSYFGDTYTDSASGSDQFRQVTGLDVDSETDTGTQGLLIDGCRFMNIMSTYTAMGGTEGDAQADGIQLAGINARGKPTRGVQITNCKFSRVSEAIDCFGDNNLIENNQFEWCFETMCSFKNGASGNIFSKNIGRNIGLSGVGLFFSSETQDVDSNQITDNTILGITPSGDWYATPTLKAWDATAAGRAAWGNQTTQGVYINYGSDNPTSKITNTVIRGNVLNAQLNGDGAGKIGIRSSNHIGSRTNIVIDNAISNFATSEYSDDQRNMVLRKRIDAPAIIGIYQNSNHTLTSSTSAQKLFNSSPNGAANLKVLRYRFRGEIDLQDLDTGSSTFAIGFGGTATITSIRWRAHMIKGAGNSMSAYQTTRWATATGGTVVSASASPNGGGFLEGVVRIATDGTFIPQITLSAAAAAIVSANSFFELWPIAEGAATYLGDWT